MSETPTGGLLDADRAAEYLSTSRYRLDALRRGKRVEAVRDGRGYKYLRSDLDKYIRGLETYTEVERKNRISA